MNTSELKTHLIAGDVCVFPTDTVVGIGCLAYMPGENFNCSNGEIDNCRPNFNAVKKIFQIKNRAPEKKLPWLVGDTTWLGRYGSGDLSFAEKLAADCWPGSTTLIIKSSENIASEFTVPASPGSSTGNHKNYSTIALRMPACNWLLEVLSEINLPIACTSANLSGEPAVASVVDVSSEILDSADYVFDYPSAESTVNTNASGIASQIFDCSCGEPKKLR